MLLYTESTKQTYAIGELLTSSNFAPASPIASFTGPMIVVDGVEDGIFCGGNQLSSITAQPNGPAILDGAKKNFLVVRAFEGTALKETGHAINSHYSAREGYEPTRPFLKSRRDCAEMMTRIARYAAGTRTSNVILQRKHTWIMRCQKLTHELAINLDVLRSNRQGISKPRRSAEALLSFP